MEQKVKDEHRVKENVKGLCLNSRQEGLHIDLTLTVTIFFTKCFPVFKLVFPATEKMIFS